MALDSTSKTHDFLKAKGWMCAKVESRVHDGRSQDLWGLFDLVAVSKQGTLWVQACGTDIQTHIKKYRDSQHSAQLTRRLLKVMETPNTQVLIVGWKKVLIKRGGKAYVHQPTILQATPDGEGGVLWVLLGLL